LRGYLYGANGPTLSDHISLTAAGNHCDTELTTQYPCNGSRIVLTGQETTIVDPGKHNMCPGKCVLYALGTKIGKKARRARRHT
jgi:hypothetical protein